MEAASFSAALPPASALSARSRASSSFLADVALAATSSDATLLSTHCLHLRFSFFFSWLKLKEAGGSDCWQAEQARGAEGEEEEEEEDSAAEAAGEAAAATLAPAAALSFASLSLTQALQTSWSLGLVLIWFCENSVAVSLFRRHDEQSKSPAHLGSITGRDIL